MKSDGLIKAKFYYITVSRQLLHNDVRARLACGGEDSLNSATKERKRYLVTAVSYLSLTHM